MDPLTILAAFAPVAVDGVKALINRFLGTTDFKPATIDDFIKSVIGKTGENIELAQFTRYEI